MNGFLVFRINFLRKVDAVSVSAGVWNFAIAIAGYNSPKGRRRTPDAVKSNCSVFSDVFGLVELAPHHRRGE